MDVNDVKRVELYQMLGKLPPLDRKIHAKTVAKESYDSYDLEKIVLDLNGIEEVPAYFILPKDLDGPVPAVLYQHAHGGKYDIGKDEIIHGRNALQSPTYAEELASRGIAALCIDTWAFGERSGKSELTIFKHMLWHGQSMLGMMLYDSIRSLDYLISREEVDGSRIATMGISMGSTLAWWTAALDTRIKVVIDLCCLTDFQALIDEDGLDRHGIFYYVPDLINHFSTADINALIAPRPHLSIAGTEDALTPVAGLDRIDRELTHVYQNLGASDAWKLNRYPVGHVETKEMREDVLKFLDEWL